MYIDQEKDNYAANYGYIGMNDKYFDDHPELGPDFLRYKISKIKFFKHPKGDLMVIGGIETTYLNLGNNTEITSQESKGKNVDQNKIDEFPLQRNEYITSFTLWQEEGSINKISFKTNLKRSYSVGDQKGRELRITELDEDKKIILSFFGTYNDNYLSSIGVFLPKKNEFFDYFMRGYFELFIIMHSKKYKGRKQFDDVTNNTLIKVCQLPKPVFLQIMKYTVPS